MQWNSRTVRFSVERIVGVRNKIRYFISSVVSRDGWGLVSGGFSGGGEDSNLVLEGGLRVLEKSTKN